jgi:hypothetical protein
MLSEHESRPATRAELAVLVLVVVAVIALIALLFRALHWPVLLGATLVLCGGVAGIGLLVLLSSGEPKPSVQELAERERLLRQLTAVIEAETDHRTAEVVRDFLDRLSPEERALLGLRLHAEACITRRVGDLEHEITALRAELTHRLEYGGGER